MHFIVWNYCLYKTPEWLAGKCIWFKWDYEGKADSIVPVGTLVQLQKLHSNFIFNVDIITSEILQDICCLIVIVIKPL